MVFSFNVDEDPAILDEVGWGFFVASDKRLDENVGGLLWKTVWVCWMGFWDGCGAHASPLLASSLKRVYNKASNTEEL